jgi:hypothetical protein
LFCFERKHLFVWEEAVHRAVCIYFGLYIVTRLLRVVWMFGVLVG